MTEGIEDQFTLGDSFGNMERHHYLYNCINILTGSRAERLYGFFFMKNMKKLLTDSYNRLIQSQCKERKEKSAMILSVLTGGMDYERIYIYLSHKSLFW